MKTKYFIFLLAYLFAYYCNFLQAMETNEIIKRKGETKKYKIIEFIIQTDKHDTCARKLTGKDNTIRWKSTLTMPEAAHDITFKGAFAEKKWHELRQQYKEQQMQKK